MKTKTRKATRIINMDLLASEAYNKLVLSHCVTECPTSMTDSAMGAIKAALLGEYELCNICAKQAGTYSGLYLSEPRYAWLTETIQDLTGHELPPLKDGERSIGLLEYTHTKGEKAT